MTEIERLAALEEIRALKARYWIGVDTCDRDLLLSTFAPDAIIPAFGDVRETRRAAAFVDHLIALMRQTISIHLGGAPAIAFQSDDQATGIWPVEDRIWAKEGATTAFRTLHGWGHYHDEYRRTQQGWKIQSFRLVRLRVDVE